MYHLKHLQPLCACLCHLASGVQAKPVPSLLRGFSAPVKMAVEGQTDDDLVFLLAHDTGEGRERLCLSMLLLCARSGCSGWEDVGAHWSLKSADRHSLCVCSLLDSVCVRRETLWTIIRPSFLPFRNWAVPMLQMPSTATRLGSCCPRS